VNNRPWELSFYTSSSSFLGGLFSSSCVDAVNADRPSCGYAIDNKGQRVPDSVVRVAGMYTLSHTHTHTLSLSLSLSLSRSRRSLYLERILSFPVASVCDPLAASSLFRPTLTQGGHLLLL
jgi:hypothetical protein